eukprot:78775-Prorocentrum_minimum.AAC.1
MIALIDGLDNVGYLARTALQKGNNKPFLVNRCGIMYPVAAEGVFEIDVDVHNFQVGPARTANSSAEEVDSSAKGVDSSAKEVDSSAEEVDSSAEEVDSSAEG